MINNLGWRLLVLSYPIHLKPLDPRRGEVEWSLDLRHLQLRIARENDIAWQPVKRLTIKWMLSAGTVSFSVDRPRPSCRSQNR